METRTAARPLRGWRLLGVVLAGLGLGTLPVLYLFWYLSLMSVAGCRTTECERWFTVSWLVAGLVLAIALVLGLRSGVIVAIRRGQGLRDALPKLAAIAGGVVLVSWLTVLTMAFVVGLGHG